MYFIEDVGMKKTVFNAVLSTALIMALGVSVSACSGGEEHEEVMAIDRVDEAAELAIKNAPPCDDWKRPTGYTNKRSIWKISTSWTAVSC